MQSFTYTITEENGIHARPAGLLADMAKKTNDSVTLFFGEKKADAKRLMSVMGLGVKKNDVLTVEVDGENEQTTAKELESFMKNNL